MYGFGDPFFAYWLRSASIFEIGISIVINLAADELLDDQRLDTTHERRCRQITAERQRSSEQP